MGMVVTAIELQNIMFGPAYGEERLDGRNDSLTFRRHLYNPYGNLLNPSLLMHVWGEVVYEYNSTLTEALAQMPASFPPPDQMGWMRKRPCSLRTMRLRVGGSPPPSKWRVVWAFGGS